MNRPTKPEEWIPPNLRSGASGPHDLGRAPTVISPIDVAIAAADTNLGTVVGRFQIEAVLGQGTMARVYRVLQQDCGLRYAMKILDGRFARNPEMLARFRSEGTISKLVESDHVVRTLEQGVTPAGESYLVMELLEGSTLAEQICEGPLGLGAVRDVLLQLCEVLGASHARGIVHRDLKPENIFLQQVHGRLPFVKLMDFGLARLSDAPAVTQHGALIGTPDYMAPEQCAGQPADGRADIYSLGIIGFELATGQRPFSGTSAIRVMMAHLQNPPPVASQIRPELPPAFDAVLARALEKAPAARFQSAAEMARAIASALPEGDGHSAQQREHPRLLVDLDASISISGATERVRIAELALGGAFVVTPKRLPAGAPLRVAIDLVGRETWLDAAVVRAAEQGLAVRFTVLPEPIRAELEDLLTRLRAASAWPRPSVLERFAGPPASLYQLLDLPLDSPRDALAAAAHDLSNQLDLAGEACRADPRLVRAWDVARQLLDAWAPATDSHLARTAYDAGIGNWRGVARALAEGLPDADRAALQAARRAQNPASEIQLRLYLGRAALAEAAKDLAAARQEIEAALNVDPLNRELLTRWARLAPAPSP